MKPVTVLETADKKYWIKRYEFEGMEAEAKAVALMPSGDIVIAGSIKENKKDAKSSGLVARLDREGNVKWVRILGGSNDDEFSDVKVAPNGDIIVAGYTYSFGAGKEDFWVLRLDENGNVKWQKTYGGSRDDEAYAVAISPNGDIIVVGYTESFEGGGTWVLRLDLNGNAIWQKNYGEKYWDIARAVAILFNGEIIVAGVTESFGAGAGDVWVLRLDGNGNIKWQKTYGGEEWDRTTAVAVAPNGDIIVAGHTSSFSVGNGDVWVLRLDEDGNVKWQKTYGGEEWDSVSSVAITPNGDIIAVGGSVVAKIPPDGNFPNCDLWKDTNAIAMDTNAVVKNTNCTVTVPPLKPGFFRKEYVRITDTATTIRTAVPKVKVLCEWPSLRSLDTSSTQITVEPGRVPRVIAGELPFPIYLTGLGGELLGKAAVEEGFRGKLSEAVSELMFNKETLGLISTLIGKYGMVKNLNINFSPSNLEFNGFSASLEMPMGEIHGWNVNLSRSAIILRPEKGNRSLETISLRQDTVNAIKQAAAKLEDLIKVASELKSVTVSKTENSMGGPKGRVFGETRKLTGNRALSDEVHPSTKNIRTEVNVSSYPTIGVQGFPSSLLSRYEPLEFLGEGGFARVYKVKRRKDGKIVALKIPRIDERTVRFFVKEVASWYQLNHPNIVTIYEANVYPIPYIEMEFIEGVTVGGKTIRDLDKYPKPVDEKTALKLITGIAKGLQHAHSKGIYHLDLKPLNILLKADLTPKITDWGLAKISARSSLSRHYGYSPLYAAPEQLDEETFGVPDHRSDIWQLGVIFYQLVTGRLPFEGDDLIEVVSRIATDEPIPPGELNPEAKDVEHVILTCLRKDKEERYQSVAELQFELATYLGVRYKRELKRSITVNDAPRAAFYAGKLMLMFLKMGDLKEAYKYASDLKFYARGELSGDVKALAEQIKLRLEEGLGFAGEELLAKAEVIAHKVSLGFEEV